MTLIALLFVMTILTGAVSGFLEGSRSNLMSGIVGGILGSGIGLLSIPCLTLPLVCVFTLIRRLAGISDARVDQMWDEKTGLNLAGKLLIWITCICLIAGPPLAWIGSRVLVQMLISR